MGRKDAGRSGFLLLLAFGAAMLAGCANVHHIEVGSVPDDYRTRHPIVVSQATQEIEIPVTTAESRLPWSSETRVQEFARRFKADGASVIQVLLPYGSVNEGAARHVSSDVVAALRSEGVDKKRIFVRPYHAVGLSGPAPIRLAYTALEAHTAPCGRWPEDLGNTSENKNYFNFGCATQQNLAAQIADPRDLLAPRGMSEIDATRRNNVLENYRKGQPTASQSRSSEVDLDF